MCRSPDHQPCLLHVDKSLHRRLPCCPWHPGLISKFPARNLYSGPRSISNVYWPGRSFSTTLCRKAKWSFQNGCRASLDRAAARVADEDVDRDRLLASRRPRPGFRTRRLRWAAIGSAARVPVPADRPDERRPRPPATCVEIGHRAEGDCGTTAQLTARPVGWAEWK